MADHLVVIGKGRLIADASVDAFVATYARKWVRVRSPRMAALAPALQRQGATVDWDGPDQADVRGLTAATVGDTAAHLGIALHELAPQSSSLEEAFLEGTGPPRTSPQEHRPSRDRCHPLGVDQAPQRPLQPRAADLGDGRPVALTLLLAFTVQPEDVTAEDTFSLLLVGDNIGQLLLGVLGVLVIGQEYRHTTIRVTFTADPNRARVMTAKAVVIAATGLIVGGVATLFSYVLGNAILTSRDMELVLEGSTQVRALAGAVLLFSLYGLVGLGLGRSSGPRRVPSRCWSCGR